MKTTLTIALLALSSVCHSYEVTNYDFNTGQHTTTWIDKPAYSGGPASSMSYTYGKPRKNYGLQPSKPYQDPTGFKLFEYPNFLDHE